MRLPPSRQLTASGRMLSILSGASGIVFAALIPLILAGCGAMHPDRGVPVQAVSNEFKACPKGQLRPIDLSLLRQTPPREHVVDTGDVLGIYVEGILGSKDEVPPVQVSSCDKDLPPSTGYPIPVRSDGTIALPLSQPIMVRGLTFRQVEDKLRFVYTQQNPLLKTGQERILVGLQRPRTFRILVLRQEAGNSPAHQGFGANQVSHNDKRGVGRAILLPAYRNDVLNALAETGGLPGLDAENAVYIMRRGGGTPSDLGGSPPCDRCSRQQAGRGRGRQAVVRAQSPEGRSFYAPPPRRGTARSFYSNHATPNWRYPGSNTSSSGIRQVGHETDVPYLGVPGDESRGLSPDGAPAEAQGTPFYGPANPGQPGLGLPNGSPQGWTLPSNPPGNQFGSPDGSNPAETIGGHSQFSGNATIDSPGNIRIPLRLAPGEQPTFNEQDILLYDGDVLFVDSRDHEFFYTGGLLGGGQFNLPRDYDIDVLDAIAISEGHYGRNFINRPTKALGGVSILNKDVTAGASQVVVFRKLPDGQEIPIKIDLRRALQDPTERLAIVPGDRIILEYTRCEAVGAFLERHLFEGFLIGAATTFLYNK